VVDIRPTLSEVIGHTAVLTEREKRQYTILLPYLLPSEQEEIRIMIDQEEAKLQEIEESVG
jgi:hypothetical protein